jgi:hypothetical protein
VIGQCKFDGNSFFFLPPAEKERKAAQVNVQTKALPNNAILPTHTVLY